MIALTCLIAVSAGVIAHHAALGERERLEADAVRRYGYVSVTVHDDSAVPPDVAHLPGRRLARIAPEIASTAQTAAQQFGLRLHGRFEGAAYESTEGRVRTFIAVGPDDPVRRVAAGDRLDRREFSVAIGRAHPGGVGDRTVDWHRIPPAMVVGMTADGTLVIESSWVDRLLHPAQGRLDEEGAAVNVLASDPPGIARTASGMPRDPAFMTPFVAAFELAERLAGVETGVHVVAWPQKIGYGRAAAPTGADLLRPFLLAVASVAVGGATAVAARNRERDIVLLRTLGFGTDFIRRVYVRECGLAAVGACVVVLIGLLVASRAGVSVAFDGPVRRTLVAGVLLPPLVAFVVLRGRVRARTRAEATEW